MVDILIPIFFAKILKNTSRIKKNKRSIKDVFFTRSMNFRFLSTLSFLESNNFFAWFLNNLNYQYVLTFQKGLQL